MSNVPHSSAGVYTKIRDFSRLNVINSGLRVAMVGEAERGPVNMPFRTLTGDDWTDYFGKRNHKNFGFMGAFAELVHKFTNQLHNLRLAPEARYAVLTCSTDDPKANVPKINLSPRTNANGEVEGVLSPDEIGWLPNDPLIDTVLGCFFQANPGDWAEGTLVFVQPSVPKGLDPIKNRNEYDPTIFRVQIFENYVAGAMPTESHLVTFDHYVDGENRQYEISEVLERDSKVLRFKRNKRCPAVPVLRTAKSDLRGGTRGRRATSDEIAVAYTKFFSDPEQLSPHLLLNCQGHDHIVHRAMVAASAVHNNCRAFLHIANDKHAVREAVKYREQTLNLDTYYGALYVGDFLVFDDQEARKVYVPVVAFAAGAYAAANFVRAPAGLRMSEHIKVLGTNIVYDQPMRNVLTNAQINYARKMPDEIGGSFAIWEQLTLYRRPSALRNINASAVSGRVLELVASRAKYGLFDPNDIVLRQDLKTKATDELTALNLLGAFNTVDGATPFEVICDHTNNPNTAIANGDLILDVIIDPANSVRRIFFRYNINPKGSRVTEIQ